MNPFSLTFGKEPVSAINRDKQVNEIVEGFTSENPEYQVCMITGVRGSGKTVMMTEISSRIKEEKNWIVIELSPDRNMLQALAAELSNRFDLTQIFKEAKINLSVLGLGLELDSAPPITDIAVALDRMLAQLTKKGRKVLVTVDETVANQNVREFASQFQIYIRKQYNVFLLMTGLYEKIYELQNEDTLTFLYRAPKVLIDPLNSDLIAKQYRVIFDISEEEAKEMANIVKGYPYAYQVLGYLCYKNQCSYKDILYDFDAYLNEYVYDKIWSEMSEKDRKVAVALANSETGKIEDIRNRSKLKANELSVYRDRLLKRGLIKSSQYGYLEFTLPRFTEFVKKKYK
ncbi:MAG: ATP-binding protein [Clostridia bacterium]|nr:ATP-binding protein [Clostridia bacterium]MBQ9354866.1 ATP-binding protein [Clostridia bacterium]